MSQHSLRSPNLLLAALPEADYQRLKPHLTSVSFAAETILYRTSEKIFPKKQCLLRLLD